MAHTCTIVERQRGDTQQLTLHTCCLSSSVSVTQITYYSAVGIKIPPQHQSITVEIKLSLTLHATYIY